MWKNINTQINKLKGESTLDDRKRSHMLQNFCVNLFTNTKLKFGLNKLNKIYEILKSLQSLRKSKLCKEMKKHCAFKHLCICVSEYKYHNAPLFR